MNRFDYAQAGSNRPGALQRLTEAMMAYVRSRRAEHWVMFLAGLALGIMLG